MNRNDASRQFDSPETSFRRTRITGWLLVVGLTIAAGFPQSLQTAFAQTSSETSLPLPAHPGRTIAPPEATRPKTPASLTKQKKAFPTRTSDRPPVPGHPARNLAPPGPSPEEEMEEPEEEEEEEEEPPPGLLLQLPHEFREGGITVEYIYTGETFNNTRGGLNTNRATNYRSNFDLVFQIDSQKMGWWEGGKVVASLSTDRICKASHFRRVTWVTSSCLATSIQRSLTRNGRTSPPFQSIGTNM